MSSHRVRIKNCLKGDKISFSKSSAVIVLDSIEREEDHPTRYRVEFQAKQLSGDWATESLLVNGNTSVYLI